MITSSFTRVTPSIYEIIETTAQKRELLDHYPGTQDRSRSRMWGEELKNLEVRLRELWDRRRVELSQVRDPKSKLLESVRFR